MRSLSFTATALAAALLLTLAAPDAEAARKDIVDLTTAEGRVEAAKEWGFVASKGTMKKKHAFPKKVAIASFAVRYSFWSQKYGDGDQTYLQLSDEDYQSLTDGLYAATVERLTALGYEVAPMEQVVATTTYQDAKGQDEERENGRRVVYAPTGMKNLKQVGGAPHQATTTLAGINHELGTDAFVTVYANFGICEMQGSVKKGKGGTKLCLRGENALVPAMLVNFYGGVRDSGTVAGVKRWSPLWSNGFARGYVGDGSGTDVAPIVYDEQVVPLVKRTLWKSEWAVDTAAFADGANSLYLAGFDVGYEAWLAATAKLRQ